MKSDRDQKVLDVLLGSSDPLGPTDIARRIAEPWCVTNMDNCYATAQSAPIVPILRRIKAVRHKNGLYTKP